MEEDREKRQELHRLLTRQLVALLLDSFRLYYERKAGFDISSDPNPGKKTKTGGHFAFDCASEFNTLAYVCFLLVISRITVTPVVVERMRRSREACDANLVIGSICLLISLAFSAYLRLFVVG